MPLTGTHRHHLSSHFQNLGLCSDEAKEKINSRQEWYGIVDGVHRHTAIVELMNDENIDVRSAWEKFKWPVTMLKGGFSLLTLKQLARSQNEKHSDCFYVEPTFYDVLSGLREEYDRLQSEKSAKKITIAEVAAAYDGASHAKESTMKQIAATAARLSHPVIDTIGSIMNQELIELAAVQLAGQNRMDYTVTRETITSKVDCRVFRKFINITSLKQSTIFMKAEGEHGEQIQINTLYRVREICQERRYKPVQHTVVSEQYKKASNALQEAIKFGKFLDSNTWPTDMEATRENLLRTTRLDNDVEENSGNDNEILPVLRSLYFKLYPCSGPMKEAKYRTQFCVSKCTEDSETDPPIKGRNDYPNSPQVELDGRETTAKKKKTPGGMDLVSTTDKNDKKADKHVLESNFPSNDLAPSFGDFLVSAPMSDENEAECGQEGEPVLSRKNDNCEGNQQTQTSERLDTIHPVKGKEINADNDDPCESISPYRMLQEKGVECHQMTWQEYDVRVRKSDDAKIDMILTDPPYGLEPNASGTGQNYNDKLDDKEMSAFCQFSHRVLKSGGFIFIFSSVRYLQKWISCLRDSGFKTMSHIYSITKCSKRIQFHRLSVFPQNITEYGIVARKGGTHPQQFEPDFISPYHRIPCPLPRRFAAITNVPVPSNKLKHPGKKTNVRVEEKNPDLLIELMTTFCPDGGSVLDAYGGTFSTALACMETGRSCLSVEKDAECFRHAHARLRKKVAALKRSADRSKTMETDGPPRKQQRVLQNEVSIIDSKSTKSGDAATMKPVVEHAVREHKLESLRPGNDVEIFREGKFVGLAQLAIPAPGEEYPVRRLLHNRNLADISKEDQCLVVIWRVRIIQEMKNKPYPYEMPGVEEKPKTLADMVDSFYAWDAGELRMVTSSAT